MKFRLNIIFTQSRISSHKSQPEDVIVMLMHILLLDEDGDIKGNKIVYIWFENRKTFMYW